MLETEPSPSSSSLLAAVQRHDPQAWQRLTAIYGPAVFGWCRRSGLQAADAADLMQAVFATVAANVAQFRKDRPGDSFRGWLWTIFHSRLMDFFRRERRHDQPVGDSEVKRLKDAEDFAPPPTTSTDEEHEAAGLVRRALEIVRTDFSEKTWTAFWRTTVDGDAVSDVARAIELSPSAVCMARSRVLSRLRETLAGLGLFEDGNQ